MRRRIAPSIPVILIVEDEPALQKAMRRALERSEFTVRTAFDCRKALALLEGGPTDVVCVNLSLPDQSGYELCEQIRRMPTCSRVLIVVMGDGGFPEHMVHAERAGANAFLAKPFSVESLVGCVEALLSQAPASSTSSHLLRGSGHDA